jgi:hypothetical protein
LIKDPFALVLGNINLLLRKVVLTLINNSFEKLRYFGRLLLYLCVEVCSGFVEVSLHESGVFFTIVAAVGGLVQLWDCGSLDTVCQFALMLNLLV